jgi:hypothetical protein
MRRFILAVSICLFPSAARALDMEYHTYNGFDPIVTAFQKISLIFGHNSFRGLVFSVVVAGILFGGLALYMKALMGNRFSLGAWLTPLGIGVVLYLGLIIPTGNLIIYDDVLNRFQAVPGVPNGIVAVAGVTNLIESGLVEIIDSVSAPGTPNYKQSAGGIGFNLLMKATGGNFSAKLPDAYMTGSLDRYIRDCVTFEILRPGSLINLNTLLNTTSDMRALFAEAVHPSIYTVIFDAANPNGVTMSCTEAWNNHLSGYINEANLAPSVQAMCSDAGINVANADEYMACQQIAANHIAFASSAAITPNNLIMQAVLSNMLSDAVLYADPDTAAKIIANRQQVSTGVGLGLMASEWLPVAKAVVTAIAVGLLPFVVLLLPTPLSGRSLQLVLGFFIWLMAWGITDAVVNSFAVDQAYKVFDSIRQHNYSMVSMSMFPDAAMKAYSMFGLIRTAGIAMATVITTLLIRFGGTALAHLAGGISGAVHASGAEAGRSAWNPEGIAKVVQDQNIAVPTMANANRFDWQARTGSETLAMGHRTGGGLGWGTQPDALAAGFGTSSATLLTQRRKIAESGSFTEWQNMEAMTGSMRLMGDAGKRMTWDIGMNEFRRDYIAENPGSSFQEASNAGYQFFGSFMNPRLATETYRGLRDAGVRATDAFDRMVTTGSFGSEKGYMFTLAEMNMVRDWGKERDMSPQQVMSAWGEFNVADTAAKISAFESPQNYQEFRKVAYGLDWAQQKGLVEAAREAGYDPRDTVQTSSFVKHLETIGALQMYKEGKVSNDDLLLIGSSRMLTEKGLAHARQDIATVTGVEIDQAEEFLRSREGLISYARFENMERFARAHGHSFMDLARDSQRTIALDVDGKSAASWGLPGAGHYSVSWNRGGGYVFTDRKSGSQYQVGVFGHSGRSEFVHDEKGTLIFHGTNATYGDKEERRSFRGNIDGHDFTEATLTRTGDTFSVTGRVADGSWLTVDGRVTSGTDGKMRFVSESFKDSSGGKYSPESAFAHVITYHSVPEGALRNTQTKSAYARAFVEQMRYLRGEDYNLSRVSAMGIHGHGTTGKNTSIISDKGDTRSGANTSSIAIGFNSDIQRRTNVSEAIDLQYREVMKMLDKHENTSEGRQAMGADLIEYYDKNASKSSTRETNMLSGGSWKRKEPTQ